MTLNVDLYWSFRSPYSYLATPRLYRLSQDFDVNFKVKPVYPIAVRMDGFFKTVNPLWVPYLLKDTQRIAEMEGLKYRFPSPDPVLMNMETGEVPKDQPFIYRLTRLGVVAADRGQGLPFLYEVSSVIWGGTKDWHEGTHLAAAAQRAGLDLAEMDEEIARDAELLESRIRNNEEEQQSAGHWGVPLMVFEGEPFFGQDRIDALIWRLEQNGLTKK